MSDKRDDSLPRGGEVVTPALAESCLARPPLKSERSGVDVCQTSAEPVKLH